MYTKEAIARAALEAGVGVEKIREMLKLLPEEEKEEAALYLPHDEIMRLQRAKSSWYKLVLDSLGREI